LNVSMTSSASSAPSKPSVIIPKSGGAKKLGGGVKKLSMNIGSPTSAGGASSDLKMESFEAVEKRVAKAQKDEQQKEQQHQQTKALLSSDPSSLGDESRVKAAIREVESASAATSIYRSQPSTSSTGGGRYGNLGTSSSSRYGVTSSSSTGGSVSESFEARDRYKNAKSISSDDFFNKNEDQNSEARDRLRTQFSGATAIGSDMLYGGGDGGGNGGSGGASSSSGYRGSSGSLSNVSVFTTLDSAQIDQGLDKLKDSVKDFFSDIQRRIV
jgi:hypothetical protein